MNCAACGKTNREGQRFCTHCGAALVPQTGATTQSAPPANARRTVKGDPAAPEQWTGRILAGKYRLDSFLGAGGMGTVYSATRLLIGDQAAVKILHPAMTALADGAERFRREAQAAARLKHPNVVTIYDFGEAPEGLLYLVMELVEGENLRQLLRRNGPLVPALAAEILCQAAAALDEAHRRSIVHRDLKPDNLVLRQTPAGISVKVLDFGIAKLRDVRTLDQLTQTGMVLGTPQYMSPEQCLGEELDGRADVYGLGIMLFEMLTGALPFNAPSASAVIVQQVNQTPPSPRTLNSNLTTAIEAVVLSALQKSKAARPQTAGALAQQFLAAVQGPAFDTPATQLRFHPPPAPATPAAVSGPPSTPQPLPAQANPARSKVVVPLAAEPAVALPAQANPAQHKGIWALTAIGILILLGVGWLIVSQASKPELSMNNPPAATPLPMSTVLATPALTPAASTPKASLTENFIPATPAPAATPGMSTAENFPRLGRVIGKSATIFDQPNTGGEKLAVFSRNAGLRIGRGQGRWYQVKVDDNRLGWIDGYNFEFKPPCPSAGASSNARVIKATVLIRIEPAAQAASIETLGRCEGLVVLSRKASNSPWYQVKSSQGRIGWLHGDDFEFINPNNDY